MAAPKPGIERAIEVACKRLSERALKVLENALDPVKTPGIDYKMRIMAAQELLSRAWGKPKASVESKVTFEGGDALLNAMKNARARAKEEVSRVMTDNLQAAIIDNKPTLN